MNTDFGILASTLNLDEIEDYELPPPAPDGRIRTPNQMGYVTTKVLDLSAEFVDFAATCEKPVLDGGAAYGVATIAALKKGATVIANEITPIDLNYIAKSKELTDDDRKRLYLKEGKLPEGVDFPENSLGAIHMSRVLHFFHPNEVEKMFEKAFKWLTPGGRFYLLTASPYHYATPEIAKMYNKRFNEGIEFPGENAHFMFNAGGNEPKNSSGSYLHVMDPRVIFRVASKYGFLTKKIALFGGKKDSDYTVAIFFKPEDE